MNEESPKPSLPPAEPKTGETPPVSEPAEAEVEAGAGARGGGNSLWPFWMVVLTPMFALLAVYLSWRSEALSGLRLAWIAMWSVLPGFAFVAAVGSCAQLRRRPFLGIFSLLLAVLTIGLCWWAIDGIRQLQFLE
ncbi:MAG: hypothetical protein PHV34_06155 [Verrucomicrobiae bacterium]|nr:hypothetical protein [Verrucomicrobiae bacterium]